MKKIEFKELDSREIGKRIELLEKNNDTNDSQVADLLNVSQQAAWKWRKGLSMPSTQNTVYLAELFDTSCDYILIGKNLDQES